MTPEQFAKAHDLLTKVQRYVLQDDGTYKGRYFTATITDEVVYKDQLVIQYKRLGDEDDEPTQNT